MGCFGLGLSRIFTVMVELLSTKTELRWPKNLAPYTVCIIAPKVCTMQYFLQTINIKNYFNLQTGSKEENSSHYIKDIIDILTQLNIDIILDDRTYLTIGNRLMHARITGFPYVVIVGKSILQSPPLIEIHDISNSRNYKIPLDNLSGYFSKEDTKI